MAAILISTIREYDSLDSLLVEAAQLHEADAVAAGAPVLGRLPFGIAAIDATGRATLAETLAGKVISW